MSTDADCLFCKIVAGEIPSEQVYSDDLIVAFKDISPKAEVHVLVIPRVHIAMLDHLTEEHDQVMAHLMRSIPKIAASLGLEAGYRVIINNNHGGGQVIYHIHAHILGGRDLPGFQ